MSTNEVTAALTASELVPDDAHGEAVANLSQVLAKRGGLPTNEVISQPSSRKTKRVDNEDRTTTTSEEHTAKMASLFANELAEMQQGDKDFGGTDEELQLLREMLLVDHARK